MYNITQFWYNYIVNVFGRIDVFIKENVNKQLSLVKRKRKFEIVNELDKTQSKIAREINKHRI